MTTSEFIIGHSVDDAAERKAEWRKILWALLAALVVHLAVGYSIARFHGVFSSPIPVEEDKPVEMTIMDLPAQVPLPEAKKNSMFMETDESKASVEPPKEKTFESNANSIAASQQPATGEMPLPSQEGKDRPAVDLESHNYSLDRAGAQPQPSTAPQETPQPSTPPQTTPEPTTISNAEQFAMLTKPKPTPAVQPTVARTPAPPRSNYRQFKEKTRVSGSITNRGISSVNALGTPLGRYIKIFQDSIGSRWYAALDQHRDMAGIGTVGIYFVIDRSGRVKNVKVIENTSNETFANVCLSAVLEANLPPIPPDVADTLPSEGLEIEALRFAIVPQ
jgi:outer membrane biosynthesis protein TonB